MSKRVPTSSQTGNKFMLTTREISSSDLEGIRRVYSSHYSGEELEYAVRRARQSLGLEKEKAPPLLKYFVAEEDDNVIGVGAVIAIKEKLLRFAKTKRPIELYTLFVDKKRSGAGKALVEKTMLYAKEGGFEEMVVFSANKWKDGWGFYDRLGFERVGQIDYPTEGPAQIFRKDL